MNIYHLDSSEECQFKTKLTYVIDTVKVTRLSKQTNNYETIFETDHPGKHSREEKKGSSLIFENRTKTAEDINDNSFSVVSFPVDLLSLCC